MYLASNWKASLLIFTLACLGSSKLFAQEPTGKNHMQVLLGTLSLDDSWTITDPDGNDVVGSRDDLIYGGVFAQMSNSDAVFQAGLETGGLVSFINDSSYFVVQDGGLNARVKIENQFWLFDFGMGGYLSLQPTSFLRLYVSGGAAIVAGSLAIKEDPEIDPRYPNQTSTVVINTQDRRYDTDFSVYGRVGVEITTNDGMAFGVSARQTHAELDFDDNGVIDLGGVQYFLTLGFKY